MSRGAFVRASAGAAGAALSSPLWLPTSVRADNADGVPLPIPKGGIGGDFRIWLFGQGFEPNAITNFNGFFGVTDVQNMATDTSTGERLLVDTDMRFYDGVYVGADGKTHQGTFGFVWIDLYRGQYDFVNFSTQVHDFDLGIEDYPSGLFWTAAIPPDSVQVNFGAGRASYHVSNLPALDYGNIPNALGPDRNAFTPATVSFDIEWSGPGQRYRASDPNVGFAIDAVLNQAVMSFTATNAAGAKIVSDPAAAGNMKSAFAEIGREKNGMFFKG